MTAAIPGREMTLLMIDGVRMDPATPAVPASLLGLLRGEGVFETFVVEDGVPTPFLALNDERLRRSAGLIGFDLEGRGLCEELPAFLPLLAEGAWRVRYSVFRGIGVELFRMWSAGPLADPPAEVVLALARARRDPSDPLVGAKTSSRAREQHARRQAVAAGAWEALMLNLAGDLAECTSSNLFVACHGRLATPGLDQGLLAGVTRQGVLDGCLAAGIPVEQGVVSLEDLRRADEVYVTNAVIGVIPVCAVLGQREDLPGQAGPFLAEVRRAYLGRKQALARAVPTRRS
ncbi:MAG: aminotransferase class IV [Planctomycetes bacterium]|nr:aminotransferase class IV [Planctomycetota bacterium]